MFLKKVESLFCRKSAIVEREKTIDSESVIVERKVTIDRESVCMGDDCVSHDKLNVVFF